MRSGSWKASQSGLPLIWHRLATMLRCVSITPFGKPVVPLEYGRTTRSVEGAIVTGSDRRGRRLRRRCEQLVERPDTVRPFAEDVDLLDAGRGSRFPGFVDERWRRDQQPRARVLQLLGQLPCSAERIRGRDDSPEHR